MEMLVRLAGDKFIRNKVCDNFSDSVDMVFREGLLEKLAESEDPSNWRNERLWNKHCDVVLTRE